MATANHVAPLVPALPKPQTFGNAGKSNTDLKIVYKWFDGVNRVVDSIGTLAFYANANSVLAYAQANSARLQANTARDTANGAYDQANSAFAEANIAYSDATDAITIAELAYSQANSALDEGTLAYSTATSAFDTANAAYAEANAVYTVANNAYAEANTAFFEANAAYFQANSAFAEANAAYTIASGANSNVVLAYGQANTAYSQANAAYAQANLAYTTANNEMIGRAAYAQANLAYAQANLGIVTVNSGNTSNLVVSVSNNVVTIDTRLVGGNVANSAAATVIYSYTANANANQTSFTLSANITNPDLAIVTVNGVTQVPVLQYTVTGNNNLTFSSPMRANDVIEARLFTTLVDSTAISTEITQAYNQSNTAIALAANSLPLTGGTLTGNLTVNTNLSANVITANTVTLGFSNITTFEIVTTANGIAVTVDSFAASLFTTVKYVLQAVSMSAINSSEYFCMQDGTDAQSTEYASLMTGRPLGAYEFSVAGGTCLTTFTPNNPTGEIITIKVMRTTINS